ncbi:hypothetical protein LWI29_034035 [Acer saccharum]|uniref:SWIM-type domain-containing protein n=1 Tax=Acer saccharum TaxID=4024 RepID=A0AA39T0H4_ACESA|nr:hypothetical protein LWI29_034035 [Acer saccharum]
MFPNSEHRFCVRHMYNNFKSEHKSFLSNKSCGLQPNVQLSKGPNVFKVVERLKLESSVCHPEYSGNFHYQVRGPGDDQHIVDIDKKTCACNRWQLIGIPCIHGISAPLSSNRDPIDYIHNKYKKENFIKAYAPVIYGINGPMMWPKTNDKPLECPLFKKQIGRPKKAKALQADEVRV